MGSKDPDTLGKTSPCETTAVPQSHYSVWPERESLNGPGLGARIIKRYQANIVRAIELLEADGLQNTMLTYQAEHDNPDRDAREVAENQIKDALRKHDLIWMESAFFCHLKEVMAPSLANGKIARPVLHGSKTDDDAVVQPKTPASCGR